jgi:DNA repair exonuclease SbcCD nuclease subunit
MKKFRFIHAADLHLDSPFRGLAQTSPRLRDLLHSATFQALDRIVGHAIESESDFVLLAGDLYDSSDRSLRALVEFRRQMERLAERDIGAYVVHGNHDPLNGWGSEFQMPPNVFVFDGEVSEQAVVRHGDELARVSGISYTQERVTENLAKSFRRTPGGVYSIALLHANVGRQSGHADYAPASLTDLTESGFDYWALGHVHTRAVLSSSPAIVYPGNPQGRHAREAGPRGCFQVDVDTGGRTHLKFIETDVVRWVGLDVSITDHTRMDGLLDRLRGCAGEIAGEFEGPTVIRCRITGNGSLHTDLQREGVREELEHELATSFEIESLRIATGPEVDRERLMETEPLVGDLLRLIERARDDSEYRDHLAESLGPLFRNRGLQTPDPKRVDEWIQKAGGLGVDLLLNP